MVGVSTERSLSSIGSLQPSEASPSPPLPSPPSPHPRCLSFSSLSSPPLPTAGAAGETGDAREEGREREVGEEGSDRASNEGMGEAEEEGREEEREEEKEEEMGVVRDERRAAEERWSRAEPPWRKLPVFPSLPFAELCSEPGRPRLDRQIAAALKSPFHFRQPIERLLRIPARRAFASPSPSPSPRPAGTGLNSPEATRTDLSLRRTPASQRSQRLRMVEGACGGEWPVPATGWPVPPIRSQQARPPLCSGLQLLPAVYQQWDSCRAHERGAPSFLLLGYDPSKGNGREKVIHLRTGSGGFLALMRFLDENSVKYGAFKVNCEGSPRWVFLCFIGNSVHALSKEAAKIHWQQVASHLVGVSLSLCFTDLTQLEPKRIKKRLEEEFHGKVSLNSSYKEWHARFYESNLKWEQKRRSATKRQDQRSYKSRESFRSPRTIVTPQWRSTGVTTSPASCDIDAFPASALSARTETSTSIHRVEKEASCKLPLSAR
ncbi:MAG: hypothetical protein SGPRY_005456 [Prymnesium sp.]